MKYFYYVFIIFLVQVCCTKEACVCGNGEKILVSINNESKTGFIFLKRLIKNKKKVIDSILWIQTNSQIFEIQNNSFINTTHIKDFDFVIYNICKNKSDTISNIEYVINGGLCEEKCRGKTTFSCIQHRLSKFKIKLNNNELTQPEGFETIDGFAVTIN